MSQPTDAKAGPPSGTPRGSTHEQETILLSEVPDVSALTAEAAPAPASASNFAEVIGKRYEILGEAGHGSMGNVYKARDRETGETVALKLLKPEIASDQAMMDRFKNELLFARKITHKNVCRVYEFNRVGNVAYTSMEFVDGESLRSVLNRFGGLPVRKAVNVATQICSGLKEAHAQGIVHRDLKPENVMVDAQGNVKIMDFGIARSMEAATRMTGGTVGTPAYMAPEQVAGKPVDYRTDIYSLGLILYEMFTGTPAFHAENPVAVALKQMRESPPAPHEVDPNVPVAIERAILKCLEKEPSRRFQSIAELETGLRSPSAPATAVATAPLSSPSTVVAKQTIGQGRVLQPIAAASPRMQSKRTSPLLWTLLALLAGGSAYAAVRVNAITDAADRIPPPEQANTPAPPPFAFVKPAAQPAAGAAGTPSPTATAKSATPARAKPAPKAPATPVAEAKPQAPPPEVFPRVEIPPVRKPGQIAGQKSLGQSGFGPEQGGPTYLWVGRYGREDRAQQAAKKIEDAGLPGTVVPRHGLAGKFFVVVAGPIPPKQIQSARQILEAKGFENVHPVGYGEKDRE